ncbi:cupin domain-containing protein [Actinomadura welshii]|uniref:cupin domain-containing protein n=1 Tax=Actinomadura welshii TaxID=3103817 RepID=UPI0003AD5EB8|nr:cupin domain-containing protein [Actinomadura madurae]
MINTIPPGEPAPDLDTAAASAVLERQMPGAMAVMEPDAPGMHTTDSIDYVLVVAGEVTLELDDGEGTVLRAGDAVVQNGTRHAWRNHGTEPCTIVGAASLVTPCSAGLAANDQSADQGVGVRRPVEGCRSCAFGRRGRGRPEVSGISSTERSKTWISKTATDGRGRNLRARRPAVRRGRYQGGGGGRWRW